MRRRCPSPCCASSWSRSGADQLPRQAREHTSGGGHRADGRARDLRLPAAALPEGHRDLDHSRTRAESANRHLHVPPEGRIVEPQPDEEPEPRRPKGAEVRESGPVQTGERAAHQTVPQARVSRDPPGPGTASPPGGRPSGSGHELRTVLAQGTQDPLELGGRPGIVRVQDHHRRRGRVAALQLAEAAETRPPVSGPRLPDHPRARRAGDADGGVPGAVVHHQHPGRPRGRAGAIQGAEQEGQRLLLVPRRDEHDRGGAHPAGPGPPE